MRGIGLIANVFFGALLVAAAQPEPRVSFGVLTDIQYGDQETKGKRDYRASLQKLQAAVDALNRENLVFAIQLGDLIDARAQDLPPILKIFDRLRTTRYHVHGNHDTAAPPLAAWYAFDQQDWRFLVTDGMDISIASAEGREFLNRLKQAGAKNANDWNGAIGATQMKWLAEQLDDADQKHKRVILFCHFPVLVESSTPAHLLWNHEEVRKLLEKHASVAAWFNGHDHAGGYAERNGIHYVTFPGMVESGAANSYSIVRIFTDRIEILGNGTAPTRTLRLNPH